ncbi:hypothetical protein D9M68_951160 [compost metagenome]
MGAIIDDERGETERAGAFGENRQAELEGRVGETALGIDLDDGRAFLRVELGHGVCLHLAGLDRAQRPFNAVNAMRFTGVTLAGDDHAGECACLNAV